MCNPLHSCNLPRFPFLKELILLRNEPQKPKNAKKISSLVDVRNSVSAVIFLL